MNLFMNTSKEHKEAFTQRVKDARVAAGYTQLEMANLLGIDRDKYKQYESRSYLPDSDRLKFCTIAKVSYQWLSTGSEDTGDALSQKLAALEDRNLDIARGVIEQLYKQQEDDK